jgi:plasmid stability protein
MSRQLTIRGVPEEVAERLARLSAGRGTSMNATVLQILEQAVGFDRKRRRLERYATWTDADLSEFLVALKAQRVIDDELWT